VYINRIAIREIAGVARRRLRLRRTLVWFGYAIGFVSIRGILDVTRWIDDRLWPGIAKQKLEAPIFIFGNARSGTTLLHRMMSLDGEHFSSMKLYHSVFCSVSLIRLIEAFARVDRHIPGHPFRRLIGFVNRKVFKSWDGIHEMGLDEVEEDEAIFTFGLMTPAVALLLPYLDELPGVTAFDELPAAERRGFMDSYQDALRRHLFATGGDRTYLNKNVLLAPRIRSVFERFPDARFVYLVRSPFEAIPSFLNMFHVKWVTHSPEIDANSPESRALARLAIDYYRYALECREFIPEEQFITICYDDLVESPREIIESLYGSLGIEMSPSARERLLQEISERSGFSSNRRSTLEDFGLSEAEIFEELEDVFAEFGFEPPTGYGSDRQLA
jgi:hypothetical protein